jgi:hypothetical protein
MVAKMSEVQNCSGSVKRGNACYKCDKCLLYFRKTVLKYRKTPMNLIPKADVMVFSYSCTRMAALLGPQGFQDFVRGGK